MELKSFLAISLALAVFAVGLEIEGEDIRSRFSLKVSRTFKSILVIFAFGPFSHAFYKLKFYEVFCGESTFQQFLKHSISHFVDVTLSYNQLICQFKNILA